MTYCENCGARNGETMKEYQQRRNWFAGDALAGRILSVARAPTGYLCQYCQYGINYRVYDPQTGDIRREIPL